MAFPPYLRLVRQEELFQAGAPSNPVEKFLARRSSAKSRETATYHARRVAELISEGTTANPHHINWGAIKYEHMVELLVRLNGLIEDREISPAYANALLCCAKCILKEAWRLGLMDAEQYHRAVDVDRIRGRPPPKGRALTTEELHTLVTSMTAQKDAVQAARDVAILATLWCTGMRRSELCSLDLKDYAPDTKKESARVTVRLGKLRKGRVAFLGKWGVECVERWLEHRGRAAGPLFHSLSRQNKGQRFTDDAVYCMLKRWRLLGGLAHFSPHDLRRTFISNLLDKGVDVSTVQRLAGHESASMTIRYDRRPEETARRAALGNDPAALFHEERP